ncbi:sugar phosphate isomerase/epimerase family protein [Desulfosporosinus sp. PR]|uniref:sugar phosphate isomerase/epimerase family protein n=1 Tax=Candidatus Desulfosporosinus nitrosoreducens TaxID=3401928 RepID=UPI0027F83C38|nr:sugar phosphate isomerase/epimerase family protein [Desulfosporosinus sp. PR]MDQ7094897.1 sugar phosphate isomerase/epimerase family protein [Desulfosporosinus sp. PR]
MANQRRLGIFSWFGFVLPFQKRLSLIKEAGFDATSIWWEDEDTPWQTKKEHMPQLVKDMGLELDNLHVPYNNSNELWSERESVRSNFIQRHIRWLNDCANHHVPLMVMHLTEGLNPPAPNHYGLQSFYELVKAAEELGVTIAIENTRRSDNLPYLLSAIPSSRLGYCYDSSHYFLSNKQDFDLLKNFGERLVATHLSDNDGLEDRHWLPGHGIIDWTVLSRHFPATYQGGLTLEAYPTLEERRKSPEAYLKNAWQKVRATRDLFGNL